MNTTPLPPVPPPADGNLPPGLYPSPYGAPPMPVKRFSTAAVIAIVAGSLLALCIVGGVLVAIVSPPAQESTAQGGAAPRNGAVASAVPADNGTAPAASSSTAAAAAVQPTTEPAAPPSPAMQQAVIPNLVGLNAAVAEDQLQKLGFSNIDFGSVDRYESVVLMPSNWTIAQQSAAPGTTAPLDQLIVLSCTKHP